jgi:hypothetical protein
MFADPVRPLVGEPVPGNARFSFNLEASEAERNYSHLRLSHAQEQRVMYAKARTIERADYKMPRNSYTPRQYRRSFRFKYSAIENAVITLVPPLPNPHNGEPAMAL